MWCGLRSDVAPNPPNFSTAGMGCDGLHSDLDEIFFPMRDKMVADHLDRECPHEISDPCTNLPSRPNGAWENSTIFVNAIACRTWESNLDSHLRKAWEHSLRSRLSQRKVALISLQENAWSGSKMERLEIHPDAL
jgi:hypothetical protein